MDILTSMAVIFVILWIVGIVKPNTLGRMIHVLLIIAVVLILVRFIHVY